MNMNGIGKTRQSNEGAGSVCIAAAVFALLYLACFAGGIITEYPLSILAFVIFSIHVLYLFLHKIFFFKYIWLIVMLAWLVVADALLVMNPIWLNELQLSTFENGSLLPIAACVSATLQFILFLEVISNKSSLREDNGESITFSKEHITLVKIAGIAALVVAICAFLSVAPHPSWAVARDRFDYAVNYLPSFLRNFQSLLILLVPLAAPCMKIGANKIFYGVVGFYTLYLLWTGEKFTSLFLLLYILLLACLIPRMRKLDISNLRRIVRRLLVLLGTVIVCFLVLVFIQYVRQFDGVSAAIGTFEQRIAAQAEVWWGVYEDSQVHGAFRADEVEDELEIISITGISDDLRVNGGIWKLMRVVMPYDYFQMYVDNSTRLTSSTQATLYYYFGFPGMLIGMLVLALFYYFVINSAVSAFERGSIFEGILAVYLIRIMHGVITMSDFSDLFYWRSLLVIAFLILLAMMRAMSMRKRYSARACSFERAPSEHMLVSAPESKGDSSKDFACMRKGFLGDSH